MVSIRVSKTFDESSSLSTPANVSVVKWLTRRSAKPLFKGSSPFRNSRYKCIRYGKRGKTIYWKSTFGTSLGTMYWKSITSILMSGMKISRTRKGCITRRIWRVKRPRSKNEIWCGSSGGKALDWKSKCRQFNSAPHHEFWKEIKLMYIWQSYEDDETILQTVVPTFKRGRSQKYGTASWRNWRAIASAPVF